MTTALSPQAVPAQAVVLPKNRGAYYGGAWHAPKSGRFVDTLNPGTGLSLGKVAYSGPEDIDAAVAAAKAALNGGTCCRWSALRFCGASRRFCARTPTSSP